VQAAINSLKINKTPWNDSISAELLEQVGYLHTRMIHWGGGGSGSVVHVGCIQTRRLVVPPDQVLRCPWARHLKTPQLLLTSWMVPCMA